MLMLEFVEIPCVKDGKGKYSYPCVTGMCPYGRTFLDCYDYFDDEIKSLFDELSALRSEVVSTG